MENKKINILVIDDTEDNLISIKALIREFFADADTYTATSGAEGIKLAELNDIDVILLDIVMPVMDGFEVCKKLKEDHALSDIPVIFLTALKGDKSSRIRALEVGAEAFLSKPIDELELSAQISAMVKIKRANYAKHDEKRKLEELIEEGTHELRATHKATLNLMEDLKVEIMVRRKAEEEIKQLNAGLEQKVEQRTNELSEAYKILANHSKEITDGINYASRLQNSIIHRSYETVNCFNGCFVLLLPKDIVSGDFCWQYSFEDMHFIAAVDCTGHGVPGAMLSMVAHQFLNQIVAENKCFEPSEILQLLEKKLFNALHQQTEDMVRDGMDIALCRIEEKEKRITYAGAYRPLFYHDGNSISEIPGSKYSIGGFWNKEQLKDFPQTTFTYKTGDSIYLTSDGYYSQFNHTTGKKMMKRPFISILETIVTKKPEEQKWLIHHHFNEWKGNLDQVDDVLVVGIKL